EANKSLSGSSVSLEFDVQERDRYGRLLAYIWYGSTMLNEELVREGFCMPATYPPNVKYVDRFRDAQIYAKENKKGLWGKGGLSESPSEYRKKQRKRYYH
ncbi:MAG: thermonuclease family protein, partial [Candidatus Aenigmatarchaeota archaeon]